MEDSEKMRKVVIFGSFLAVFLLLMIPNVNSIETLNQKEIISHVQETIDYPSFVKMVKQIPKDEWRALLKDVIQNSPVDTLFCQLLQYIFLILVVTIAGIPLAFLVYSIAKEYGCEWVSSTNTDNPCSSCELEELITLIESHSQITD
jgi:ABC-type phosphate transport system permease subunit